MVSINFIKENLSPYIAGAGIGILSWLTFLFSNKPIGCSTAYANFFGFIDKFISKDKIANNNYYKKNIIKIDWQVMFVVGIVLGSFFSSLISKNFCFKLIPQLWSKYYGSFTFSRYIMSFIGGIFIGFGSRHI